MHTSHPSAEHVLVVDDHEIIRVLVARHLHGQGVQVTTAGSGNEALALLQTHVFDLVILDVMMPVLSGQDVLRQIKSDPVLAEIPVLMLSADTDTERVVACLGLGAEDYLTKPFNPAVLRARVSGCLEKRRLRLQDLRYQQTLEQRVAERTALAEQRAEALARSEAALRDQTALLQSILDSMGDGVVVIDESGRLALQNPAAQAMLGDRIAGLLPGAIEGGSTVISTCDRTPLRNGRLPLTRALDGATIDAMELLVTSEQASGQWLSISARPIADSAGATRAAVAVIRDISAAKQAELTLRESEARYALAARGANDGLWDWNLATGKVYFSPRWKAMLGYAEAEIGTTAEDWFERVHPDDREHLESRIAAHCRRLISHFEYEYRIRHHEGTYRWMLCRGLAIWDDSGVATRMAGSQTDITERKRIEQQLLHDALHDGLTGLPNRALFEDRLSHALARHKTGRADRFTVLFLDLDRFKIINDSLGHTAGDELLKSIAERLRTTVRAGDTVARLGGDEFTVLLEGTPEDSAVWEIVERIQAQLSAPVLIGTQEVFTTVSIGVVPGDTSYVSASEIIRDADTAMYQAKMGGKAQAVVFSQEMHVQALARLQLESDLRSAIDREELRAHYQPIIALDTGEIVGFEALVRWQHPANGLLAPADFLMIANETGLIVPISWWTLHAACQQLAEWQRTLPRTKELWVSVNLSGTQLTQPDIIERVTEALADAGLQPYNLKLEITEHTLIERGDLVIQVLDALRTLGVQLCIDDFGTGYSSLSYLQRLPVDVLKIDRSFINQIDEDGRRSEIIQTIVDLARTLGLQAVAEGTETPEQVRELRRLRCEYGQGWLFAKAMDAHDVEAMLRAPRPRFLQDAVQAA